MSQARILEWVAISFSRGCSQLRVRTCVSCGSYIGRQVIYHWATREAPKQWQHLSNHSEELAADRHIMYTHVSYGKTTKLDGSCYLFLRLTKNFIKHCYCSVTQSCLTLCDPMDCSMPGLPVPHHLLNFPQVHVHCIGDAIHPSHPLMLSSPLVLNLSQHQGLFQWVSSSHQVAKGLWLQLHHQSFQWIYRIDFL